MITADQLRAIMVDANGRADLFAVPLSDTAARFAIDTPTRLAAFVAQIAVESQELLRVVENLNYSAKALIRAWPHHFDVNSAAECEHQPEKIGCIAYDGRMGNGPGEGFKFRGRGLIQITGRNNYRDCGDGLALPLVDQPELLEQPENASLSAGWFWSTRRCNDFADSGDFVGLTRHINGGTEDYDARDRFWVIAKRVLGGG